MTHSVPKFIRFDKPASATSFGVADSPFGFMLAVWQDDTLIRLALLPAFADMQIDLVLKDMSLPANLPRHDKNAQNLIRTTLFPNGIWTGIFTTENTPPLGFYGTDFQFCIMQQMLRIPTGNTASYARLAQKAKAPNASRAAGSVCARNPIPFIIPCHRILASNGGLGGYAFGTALKREILRLEGIKLG